MKANKQNGNRKKKLPEYKDTRFRNQRERDQHLRDHQMEQLADFGMGNSDKFVMP